MKYLENYIIALLLITIIIAGSTTNASAKNDYLNEYGARCGDFEITTERRDTDYNYSENSTHEDEYVRFTYRKYLGTDCKTQKENVILKQQLELMKMCGRVNGNPTLKHNPEFNLLVSKCRGIAPTSLDNRPDDANSHWDSMKDTYKKKNPDVTIMGDKFIGPKKEDK
tara:strand:+ start:163 stop:666 length:504 start_codon:yes stop_codon:yes gene_type:complete